MQNRVASFFVLALLTTSASAFEFTYKGMIKAEYLYTDAATASFGGVYSQVAPTHALRTDVFAGAPATNQQAAFLDSSASSFQVAQTRFSLNTTHEAVRGVLELDFIDGADGFTNQTALQAQGPRLRLATIYYDANKEWTLFAGQKWSTASGIKGAGTFNWVGNAYRAGNSGFLAVEAGATYKKNGWSITGALTGRGRNNGVGINANELGSTPGFAMDVNYAFGNHKIGAAGHVATVNFENEPNFVSGEDQGIHLFKVFGSFKFDDVSLSAEIYTGEGLNNQNALGVAPATTLNSGTGAVRETFSESGFFGFASWNVRPGHNAKIGFGSAEVDSADRSRLSLTELSKNTTIYANYSFKIFEGLTAFGQVTRFDTEFGVDFESFQSLEARVGAVYKF